jgi:two-component system chemotaxis response regulator CheB
LSKKILIIDDSALMRRVISDIINENNDYEVAAIAKNGVEGFELILSNPTLYSAIILDINMPKMNGLELLEKLQKNRIDQTVIVVSTVAKEGAKETIKALEYGAFDFVTKPENYLDTKGDEFKKRIHYMLDLATNSRASIARTRVVSQPKSIDDSKKSNDAAIALNELRKRNAEQNISTVKLDATQFLQVKKDKTKIVALACSTG